MKTILRASISFLLVFTLITGIIYPIVTTLIAQVAFPEKANGSLLYRNGKPVGSALIGQEFKRPEYFWGRLSATGSMPYNAMASGGTNYGTMHPGLAEAAKGRVEALRVVDPSASGLIPMDLATASGSGLDPDLSVHAAQYQAERIAKVRGLSVERIRTLIREHTEGKFLGFSGMERVNVLKLNLALDFLPASIVMDTVTEISLEELKAFREDFLGFHGLDLNRISWVLTSQLFVAQKTGSFSVFSVTDQMQHLEGRWPRSNFKDPEPFRYPPLSGLFKVHFVDARFLATNLRLEMESLSETDFAKLLDEAKGDEETDVFTERWLGNLTYKLTHEAYLKRSSERRLTGEWLILGRFQDHWYYLGVAQHSRNTTQDTAIYTQLKAGCSTQFPFLFAQ